MTTNFLAQIEAQAEATPKAIAIVYGKESITYGELVQRVRQVAANILSSGAKPGDRFLYAARPTPRSLIYSLGLLRAGLTLVFVDPFSAPELFEVRSRLVKPRYVIADSLLYFVGQQWLRRLRKSRGLVICDYSAAAGEHLFLGPRLPGLPRGSRSIKKLISNPNRQALAELDIDADAVIIFTSGTTGNPKGVVHSLRTLSANAQALGDLLKVEAGQTIYAEPLTFGMLALTRGAQWVLPKRGEALPDEIDVLFDVPTDVRALLERLRSASIKPIIQNLATGGAPVLPSLVRQIDEVLGNEIKIWSVYGMTEILPVAACDARRKSELEKGDMLGSLLGDTEVKIADDDEILVRGSGLMKGYFEMAPAPWHATGDLGRLDSEYGLVMFGRKKNMLIRGDKNIYPSLYEPGISQIEGVASAHIIGVPDEIGDDRVVLIVEAESDVEDFEKLRNKVTSRLPQYLDGDAMPDALVVIERVPVSGRSSKPDISALKSIAATALGPEA